MTPAPDKEELLAQALADFLDRQARDETPTIEGFCRGYPEIADELRPQLETMAAIDNVLAPSGEHRARARHALRLQDTR